MLVNLDSKSSQKLAGWGLVLVFIFSISLRLWGLGRFNELVFDEVYYAKFANNYLTNTKFFNSHPPLSQYLIAIGIWIGDRLPFGQDTTNILTGSLHSTFSYRWMNALFGSLIVPVVAALAYQLSHRLSYALLASLFISLDGLFLIESRYALNNVYLIFFGLLGQLLVLYAIDSSQWRHRLLMAGAGIAFGAAVACKWNGISFLLGLYLLVAIAKIWSYLTSKSSGSVAINSSLDRLASLRLGEIIANLAILPIIIYSLLWIPHLIQNPQPSFIDVHLAIVNYHEQVGNGNTIHPYCANWYTWPLLMRPLAYYFREHQPNYYYDVHAMGNPVLWWLAATAVVGCGWLIFKNPWIRSDRLAIAVSAERRLRQREASRWRSLSKRREDRSATNEQATLAPISDRNANIISIPIFVIVNYAANLLPWVGVSRCLFIYHYMGAVLFAMMGLAWFVDLWLRSGRRFWQAVGVTTIFGVAASFVFWLPVYLGLSLNQSALSARLWDFWIFNWI